MAISGALSDAGWREHKQADPVVMRSQTGPAMVAPLMGNDDDGNTSDRERFTHDEGN